MLVHKVRVAIVEEGVTQNNINSLHSSNAERVHPAGNKYNSVHSFG